jgi:hypothetical protein
MEQEENGTVSIVDNSLEVSYKEPDESGNFLKEENGKLLLSSGGIHIYEPGKNIPSIPSTVINVHGISFGQNKEIDIVGQSTAPYISIGQNDNSGYANNGIYLGVDEVSGTITPRFSVSTYPDGDRLT